MLIPLPWITDRLPTRDDGDSDGYVIASLQNDKAWCEIHWRAVTSGQAWLPFVLPTAASTPEPTPSIPTPLTRRIMSIAEVEGTAMVVADDGTAWYLSADWSSWIQLPPLPKSDG